MKSKSSRNSTYGRSGIRTRNSRGQTEERSPLPKILIVCEGKKTEKLYFESFTTNQTVREVDVRGLGKNTLSLVEAVEEIVAENGKFDEVWCVFDRDDFPTANYDNAIHLIETNGYFPACSNESFELWFVLHFEYLNTAIGRDQYSVKLSKHLNQKYEKNDPELYRLIQKLGNEQQAIQNAKRLESLHGVNSPHSERCPSTGVYRLVEKLRMWEKESFPRNADRRR